MCGIVYVKRLDHAKASKQIVKRYSKQAHRGTDGFGYIGIKSNGTISPLQRTQFEYQIREKLQASPLTEILFHHRFPTSTPNVPESAHPLLVANKELQYNYYVTHNGVISNDEDLKEGHEKLGYSYLTEIKTQYRTKKGHVFTAESVFNDSEAFAIELARTIEGLQPECMAKGAIAFIAYQVEKASGKVLAVYFGTNGGNPLTMQWNKEFIAIASEGGKRIEDNKTFRLDAATNECVEVAVKLQPMYTRTAMGYHIPPTARQFNDMGESTGVYSSVYDTQEYRRGYDAHVPDEKLTLAQLEEALADVDDEIIGAAGDIQYAQDQGDDDTDYRQDMQNLLTRRTKLEALYEQKGLTAA